MAWWDNILSPQAQSALGMGQLPAGAPSYMRSPFSQFTSAGGMGQMPQMPAQTPGQQPPMSQNDLTNMAMRLMQMGQPHAAGQTPGGAAPGVMPPMQGPQQPSGFGAPGQYIAQMLQGRALGAQPASNLWAELMRRQGYGM